MTRKTWSDEAAVVRAIEERDRRLEAVGRLAGGVAHDFNNLLAVISGYAELLEPIVRRSEPGREAVAEIRRAASRAVKLTHGLLAFSRQETLALRDVDLHELVARSAPALEAALGRRVMVDLRLTASHAHIRADPDAFEQVLIQLADNSLAAMPDGGAFVVETADEHDEIRLSVIDTGVGMEPATLERAFDPFFTTRPPETGSGLGLSTIYGIVTQSGGRIRVESAMARGTTVTIVLPRVPGWASETGDGGSPV